MKKKLISTLLCVSMVAAMVAGCGSGDDTKDAKRRRNAGVNIIYPLLDVVWKYNPVADIRSFGN